MLQFKQNKLSNQTHRYQIREANKPLPFREVLIRWQQDQDFRIFFNQLLIDSPFQAFRWETPPVNKSLIHRPFEFVLLDSPWLQVPPDIESYSAYFNQAAFYQESTLNQESKGQECTRIVTFKNLGNDAELIAPVPMADASIYPHLASFVRLGPEHQIHALWQVTGKLTLQHIDNNQPNKSLWLNTAGGGVAWLHIRLDSRPKYYGFEPYKRL